MQNYGQKYQSTSSLPHQPPKPDAGPEAPVLPPPRASADCKCAESVEEHETLPCKVPSAFSLEHSQPAGGPWAGLSL